MQVVVLIDGKKICWRATFWKKISVQPHRMNPWELAWNVHACSGGNARAYPLKDIQLSNKQKNKLNLEEASQTKIISAMLK